MRRILAVAGFLLVFAFAATADARENYFIFDDLGPPTKNSFWPDVYGHFSGKSSPSVWIGAVHSWRGYSYYGKSGKVNRKRVKGKVGKFGRIDVRLEPWGYREDWKLNSGPCKGKKLVIEALKARGKLRFDGENGFAKYRAKSGKKPWFGSRITYPSGKKCGIDAFFGGGDTDPEDGAVELALKADTDVNGDPMGEVDINFNIVKSTSVFDPWTNVSLTGIRRAYTNPGVIVQSSTGGFVPTSGFRFGPQLEWADVKPLHGAFKGNGNFLRIDEMTTEWNGDLSGRLPGWKRPISLVNGEASLTADLKPYTGPWLGYDYEDYEDSTTPHWAMAKGHPVRERIGRIIKRLVRKGKAG